PRPGALLIAEPFGPRAEPELRIDVVEQIDGGAVPLRVFRPPCLGIDSAVHLISKMPAAGDRPRATRAELRRQIAADQAPVVAVVVGLLRPGDPGGRPVVALIGRIPDEPTVEAHHVVVVTEDVPAP